MLEAKELSAIAKLARLQLTADEQRVLAGELTAVLAHMAVLAEVDTAGVAPMVYGVAPHGAGEAPRDGGGHDDGGDDVLPVAVAVGGAAAVRGGQFVVPNVLPERP